MLKKTMADLVANKSVDRIVFVVFLSLWCSAMALFASIVYRMPTLQPLLPPPEILNFHKTSIASASHLSLPRHGLQTLLLDRALSLATLTPGQCTSQRRSYQARNNLRDQHTWLQNIICSHFEPRALKKASSDRCHFQWPDF